MRNPMTMCLLIVALSWTYIARAQNLDSAYLASGLASFDYHPFPSLQTRYYEMPSGNVLALKPEIQNVSDDTVRISSFNSLTLKFDVFPQQQCYTDEGSWAFRYMELWPNGRLAFYNQLSTHATNFFENLGRIVIETDAALNDPWEAMSPGNWGYPMYGEITKVYHHQFLNVEDTVKEIALYHIPPPLIKGLDTIKMIISKNYGIIGLPSFSQFDRFEEDVEWDFEYESTATNQIAGIDSIAPAVSNLTTLEIFDFAVGDILHIEELLYDQFNIGDRKHTQEQWQILDRTDSSSSVTYHFQIETQCINLMDGDSVITFDTSNRVIKYEPDARLDALPGQFLGNTSTNAFSMLSMWQGHESKRLEPDVSSLSGMKCHQVSYIDACTGLALHIKGLGGPYFSCWVSSRSLNYYRQGDVEWGEPFDVLSQTADVDFDGAEYQISIYPNPCTDILRLHRKGPGNVSYHVYSSIGKCVDSFIVHDQFNLDVNHWSPGVYFLKSEKGREVKRFIVN